MKQLTHDDLSAMSLEQLEALLATIDEQDGQVGTPLWERILKRFPAIITTRSEFASMVGPDDE